MKNCKDKAPYLHSLSAVLPKALRLCLPALPSAESFHLQLTCVLSPDTWLPGQQMTSSNIVTPRHVCGR